MVVSGIALLFKPRQELFPEGMEPEPIRTPLWFLHKLLCTQHRIWNPNVFVINMHISMVALYDLINVKESWWKRIRIHLTCNLTSDPNACMVTWVCIKDHAWVIQTGDDAQTTKPFKSNFIWDKSKLQLLIWTITLSLLYREVNACKPHTGLIPN